MKTRDVVLISSQSLSDSQTVTLDLTRGMKIQYLRVVYSATNGATSNTVGRLNGMVSKLSVVDGSSVLQSLSMQEMQARNFRMMKRMPYQSLSQAAAAVVTEECFIDFRRYLGDTAFYLDTAKYSNPQLQLTHALTISATAGFATGTGTLTVIARVIDSGAPAQLGFVMAKEIDSFASASSGDHSTDLPLDYPIADLICLAAVDNNTPDHYLSNFKLTADTDSFIPVNMTATELLQQNLEEDGQGDQLITVLNGTSYTAHGDLYFATESGVSQAGATAKAQVTVVTANELTGAGTTGETGSVTFKLRGGAPQGAIGYRFGDGASPDQVFSPQGVGKFQLKLTNSNTGATVRVVAVQLAA